MSTVNITQEQLDTLLVALSSVADILSSLEAVEPTPPPEPTPPTPDSTSNAFTHNNIKFYRGTDMQNAKEGFKSAYGSNAVDTDRVGDSWYSASANFNADQLPSATPEPTPTPTPPPTPPPEPEPTYTGAFTHNNIKFYRGTDLLSTKAGFKSAYGSNAVDTDKVGDSWYSASANFNADQLPSPISPTTPSTTSTPSTSSSGVVSAGQVLFNAENGSYNGSNWERTADGVKWTGGNRYRNDASIEAGTISYTMTLPAGEYTIHLRGRAAAQTAGRSDLHNDVWFKVDGVFTWRKHYFSGKGGWSSTTAAEIGHDKVNNTFKLTAPKTITLVMSGRSDQAEVDTITVKGNTITMSNTNPSYTSSKYASGDLVSMHFDSSMDPDDLQAMIANRHMIDTLGEVHRVVVNGTRSWENTEIITGSTEHCKKLFPETLDAHANWTGTVATIAAKWVQTLSAGGTVWVAEGGPSDFTADVLRKIPAAHQKKVIVVQHAAGAASFNESKTKPSNMKYVKQVAVYQPIGNGNHGGNTNGVRSPALKSVGNAAWFAKAYATKYGDLWRWAESKIYKDNLVDFSDTAELVYILGLVGTINNVDDFYTKFMQ